jgi:hypothetical protein
MNPGKKELERAAACMAEQGHVMEFCLCEAWRCCSVV